MSRNTERVSALELRGGQFMTHLPDGNRGRSANDRGRS